MELCDYDLRFMEFAAEQARMAALIGEAPIGAVISRGSEMVAAAHNLRETNRSALAHAEMLAIDAACRKLGGWRLHECEIYVTLEPCPMCAGAIISARIRRVVFGAYDPKSGSMGSLIDLSALPYNHRPHVIGGVMADECSLILKEFFKGLRGGG